MENQQQQQQPYSQNVDQQASQAAPGQSYQSGYQGQPTQGQYAQQPYQQPYQQPQVVVMNQQAAGKAYVNKINYILFAALLGTFGAQFFYTGKVGAGVLCVIFCWTAIPAIVGIIMAIATAFKESDANGCIYV